MRDRRKPFGHASRITHHSSSRFLNYLNNSPALPCRHRTSLNYSHDIADVRAHLVMRHELCSPPNIPFVFSMANLTFYAHDDGLLHLVAGYEPDLFLTPSFWSRRN